MRTMFPNGLVFLREQAFAAGLEAKGIEFDVPYREIPAAGLAIAFLTDPWGTYIELTEGLDEVR